MPRKSKQIQLLGITFTKRGVGDTLRRLKRLTQSIERLDGYNGPLLGKAELAKVLGVTQGTLNIHIKKGLLNLEPVQVLKCGPIWTQEQLYNYLTEE